MNKYIFIGAVAIICSVLISGFYDMKTNGRDVAVVNKFTGNLFVCSAIKGENITLYPCRKAFGGMAGMK